jgi:hypothetical protein
MKSQPLQQSHSEITILNNNHTLISQKNHSLQQNPTLKQQSHSDITKKTHFTTKPHS